MKRCMDAAAATTVLFVCLLPETCHAQDLGQGARARGYVHFSLVCADAVRAAKELTVLLGRDTDIVADKRTNTVFIRANANKIQSARDFLAQFDVPPRLFMFSLKNAEAVKTAERLKAVLTLLTLLGDDRYVHVVALEHDKAVLIQASKEKANQVEAILVMLDDKPK